MKMGLRFILVPMVLILILTILNSGCITVQQEKSEEEFDEEKLVGTWETDDGEGYVFDEYGYCYSYNERDSSGEHAYKIVKDKLIIGWGSDYSYKYDYEFSNDYKTLTISGEGEEGSGPWSLTYHKL